MQKLPGCWQQLACLLLSWAVRWGKPIQLPPASKDSLGLQAVASGNTAEAQAQATAIANSGSASAQASECPFSGHSPTTFTCCSTRLQEFLQACEAAAEHGSLCRGFFPHPMLPSSAGAMRSRHYSLKTAPLPLLQVPLLKLCLWWPTLPALALKHQPLHRPLPSPLPPQASPKASSHKPVPRWAVVAFCQLEGMPDTT